LTKVSIVIPFLMGDLTKTLTQMNINPADKGKAKAYQVRQVLQAIEKLKVSNDL